MLGKENRTVQNKWIQKYPSRSPRKKWTSKFFVVSINIDELSVVNTSIADVTFPLGFWNTSIIAWACSSPLFGVASSRFRIASSPWTNALDFGNLLLLSTIAFRDALCSLRRIGKDLAGAYQTRESKNIETHFIFCWGRLPPVSIQSIYLSICLSWSVVNRQGTGTL